MGAPGGPRQEFVTVTVVCGRGVCKTYFCESLRCRQDAVNSFAVDSTSRFYLVDDLGSALSRNSRSVAPPCTRTPTPEVGRSVGVSARTGRYTTYDRYTLSHE